MNRRQKKKAYKKKYGYNPPKSEIKYHYKYLAKAAKKIAEIAVKTIELMAKEVSRLLSEIPKAMERMRTMPEDEFNRILEESGIDEEAKRVARRIRYGKEKA